MATAIAFPDVLDGDAELFAGLDIGDPRLEKLRRAVLLAHERHPRLDRGELLHQLKATELEGIVSRLLGSSNFKCLSFVRADDPQAAKENWRKMLLELHKRGAKEELRRAGDVGDDGVTDPWRRKVEEMQREVARTQALEIDDEPPIVEPIAPGAGRTPR